MNKADLSLKNNDVDLSIIKHHAVLNRFKEINLLMNICVSDASYEEKFAAFMHLVDAFDRLESDVIGNALKSDETLAEFVYDKEIISAFSEVFSC